MKGGGGGGKRQILSLGKERGGGREKGRGSKFAVIKVGCGMPLGFWEF